MLIDWFTVGAQALNFVILVWLLQHFLYGPILKVVEARDNRVAADLADAEKKKNEATQERAAFQHKNEAFDQQRDGLLQQAKTAADAEGKRLLTAARQAAEAASQKQQEALANEAESLQHAIADRAQQEVFAIARKALHDLAAASLEERLGQVFVRRLRELQDPAKRELGRALHAEKGQALVRSAFDLPPAQQNAIQDALNETFSMAVPLRFETAPSLVSGVELTANGQKVAWSIAEYLHSLQAGVRELVRPAKVPAAAAAPVGKEAASNHGD